MWFIYSYSSELIHRHWGNPSSTRKATLGLFSLTGRLTARSLEVSKPGLNFSNRSEIWQASRQQRCRDACQFSELYGHYNNHSLGLETSRDFGNVQYFVPLISIHNFHGLNVYSSMVGSKVIRHQPTYMYVLYLRTQLYGLSRPTCLRALGSISLKIRIPNRWKIQFTPIQILIGLLLHTFRTWHDNYINICCDLMPRN